MRKLSVLLWRANIKSVDANINGVIIELTTGTGVVKSHSLLYLIRGDAHAGKPEQTKAKRQLKEYEPKGYCQKNKTEVIEQADGQEERH